MEAKKSVTIVGQGYVGLPLAQAAAKAGWKVNGLDISKSIIADLQAGKSHVDDLSDGDIQQMLGLGYSPTTDPECISTSQVVVVCVPTPLSEDGGPDLSAVIGATEMISKQLQRDTLVVLESTTYPGTTEEVCGPILEKGSGLKVGLDFKLAFSPERVDPGSKNFNIFNTPKLVGGIDAASNAAAVGFYSDFVRTVVPLSGVKEAETAKLLENTFRHVNIALVNEMAKFCHELNIDIWEVIRGASTKPFGFMPFTPGPGVGGHCIPIDPNYLSFEVRRKLGYPFRFVELAQEINNSMPVYIVQRISEILNDSLKAIRGSKILILGVTYKPDIADQRESPAKPLAQLLLRSGAILDYYDPFVKEWELSGKTLYSVEDLDSVLTEADLVVLVQPHSEFDLQGMAGKAKIFFDTKGATTEVNAKVNKL